MAGDVFNNTNLGIGGLLAAAAGFGYKIFRILKSDRREDAKEARLDDFSEKLLARVSELEERVDKMAQERNIAQVESASMRTRIQFLEKEIEELKKENSDLNEEVQRLTTAGKR